MFQLIWAEFGLDTFDGLRMKLDPVAESYLFMFVTVKSMQVSKMNRHMCLSYINVNTLIKLDAEAMNCISNHTFINE